MTETQRRQRISRFMAEVYSQEARKPGDVQPNALSERARKVLIKAALEFWQTLLAIYDALGFHGAEGKRAVDELIARGYIKLQRIPRKGRGAMPTVIEVLPDGKAELAKIGITPTELPIKRGGFRHGLYGYYQGQWAKCRGYRHEFEKWLGGKAFDFVYEDESGDLHAIETYVSGTAEYAAKQTIKGAQVKGIKRVIVACEKKAFLQEVMRKVNELDELGLFRDKIEGKLLSEYVP